MTPTKFPPGLSVIIPVYNSEGTLEELTSRLSAELSKLGDQFEVILVNDGSQDSSWDQIETQAREHTWLNGINLMRNYGQHNALLCGIRNAKYSVIVTMDDDLQNPPEEIPKLLEKLEGGYDVVYGTPLEEQHGLWRDLASWVTKLALQNAMGAQSARNVSAFRAFRTYLREGFAHYQNPYVSIDVLLTWSTSSFASVRVKHEPRRVGQSNYNFRTLTGHALNMITGFSVLPLRLASILGFIFALFGVLVLIYVVGRFIILGGSVPGFPFLASIVAIFSGVQLFVIGIIGEYLARMYYRSMDRPPYVIREEIEGEP